ncbi:MAG: hypothetical protein PUG60_16450 [Lachnospiraceae bacterium]|nr:hypothetical protein [Lachnospiraceae bacterium]
MECEKCVYFGRPIDAPESIDPDCMWVPSEENGWEIPCEQFPDLKNMKDPKINIINAHSFKEAYDAAPDEAKELIESAATDYYMDKIEKLICDFNPDDTVFIVNALRCLLAALECAYPEDYQLAYQIMPEDMIQVMKYAIQDEFRMIENLIVRWKKKGKK